MENRQRPHVAIFTKFSIFCHVAPYLTMRVKNIQPILTMLCKGSKDNWHQNKDAYKEFYKHIIKWRSFDEDIAALLKKYRIDDHAKVDENYMLSVDFETDGENAIKFMVGMKEFKLDKLKKLEFQSIEDLSDPYQKEMNRFFKYCFPTQLQTLCLSSDMTNAKNLKSGLETLLPHVTHQVYLMWFKFDQETLKSVIEWSRNAKELVLYCWKVGDIESGFTINTDLIYKIEVLDLYETCKNKEKDYLEKKKLKRLVKAMAETNLKQKLMKVHVRAQFYEEAKVHKIFSKKGFHIKVKANDKEPKIKYNSN